uniref:NADH-ubiquinone oxidoreductase chain 3 n=1 Tax=Bryopa lata TaxID=1969317 RepID=A0A1U9XPD8_9BIVA|nr:NADH dehydrogenase subunit 3 [Bryopa lata]AQZ26115.1 NADH dehydrogenase subunit 3 [Bryopa lata]
MVMLFPLMGVMLALVLMGLSWLVSMKGSTDKEKCSPYECGFDSVGGARLPFSLRFFLLAVLFLIFDVEVVLLFPLVGWLHTVDGLVCGGVFITTLLVGVYHEWREGSLDWAE